MNEIVLNVLLNWLPTIIECGTVIASVVALISKVKPVAKISRIEVKLQMLQDKIESLEERIHSSQLEAKGVKNVRKN